MPSLHPGDPGEGSQQAFPHLRSWQVESVVKIQAFFRARKARDDYRMLGTRPGPLSSPWVNCPCCPLCLCECVAFESQWGRSHVTPWLTNWALENLSILEPLPQRPLMPQR